MFYYGAAVIYDGIHILGGSTYTTNHYIWNGYYWQQNSTTDYLPVNKLRCNDGVGVVYNNEIHILGGNYNSSTPTQHYKWDGKYWVSVSTLPYSFYSGAAVVYNNEIHILGSSNTDSKTKHYKWNGTAWSEVSTLPYDFYCGTAIVYNNEIHIFGSNNSANYTKHYKWDGTEWTEVSTLPYNFFFGRAVIYNNEIHLLGGWLTTGTNHYKWNYYQNN